MCCICWYVETKVSLQVMFKATFTVSCVSALSRSEFHAATEKVNGSNGLCNMTSSRQLEAPRCFSTWCVYMWIIGKCKMSFSFAMLILFQQLQGIHVCLYTFRDTWFSNLVKTCCLIGLTWRAPAGALQVLWIGLERGSTQAVTLPWRWFTFLKMDI